MILEKRLMVFLAILLILPILLLTIVTNKTGKIGSKIKFNQYFGSRAESSERRDAGKKKRHEKSM